MDGDSTHILRPFARVADRYRSVLDRLDTTLLKRVGVVTYFGVYAAIAFGGGRVLVGALELLPAIVRPPTPAPLHVTLGLPRSVAWSLFSFTTTLLVLGALVAVSLARDERGAREGPSRPGGRSLVATLGRTIRARSVRDSVPVGLPSLGGDRTSPSTDGDDSVGPDTSGTVGSAVDGDDAPTRKDADGRTERASAEDRPDTDALAGSPEDGDADRAFTRGGATVDDAEGHGEEQVVVDGRGPADERADETTGQGRVAREAANDAGASDSPDEPAPRPDEDGPESEGLGADGEGEAASADEEWPSDWIAGDEL